MTPVSSQYAAPVYCSRVQLPSAVLVQVLSKYLNSAAPELNSTRQLQCQLLCTAFQSAVPIRNSMPQISSTEFFCADTMRGFGAHALVPRCSVQLQYAGSSMQIQYSQLSVPQLQDTVPLCSSNTKLQYAAPVRSYSTQLQHAGPLRSSSAQF